MALAVGPNDEEEEDLILLFNPLMTYSEFNCVCLASLPCQTQGTCFQFHIFFTPTLNTLVLYPLWIFAFLNCSKNIALLFLRHSEGNGKKNSKTFNTDKENVVWRVCLFTAQMAGLCSTRDEWEVTIWFTCFIGSRYSFKYLQNWQQTGNCLGYILHYQHLSVYCCAYAKLQTIYHGSVCTFFEYIF